MAIFDWVANIKEHFLDHNVDEVILNGMSSTCVISKGFLNEQPSVFRSIDIMVRSFQVFCLSKGIRLDPLHPFAGGEFDNYRYRWHCILPPVAENGPIFSLRRHRFYDLEIDNFMTGHMCDMVLKHFKRRDHLLICGPTGSGKTSFCVTLLRTLAMQERVCILEDYSEIPILSSFWVKLVSQPSRLDGKGAVSLDELFKQVLRIYPKRIILGEIKKEEWGVFMQMLSSAHSGCISTIHAASLEEVENRFSVFGNFNLRKKSSPFIKGLVCVFLKRIDGKICVEDLSCAV